ncbi:MAG: hypothetical protein A2150_07760 [Candidatus Muproteobacteria bacterium RBG_16_64_11]|uniref:Uncharacterized protein n=1 Tax=Candidatus Muproteobacteria bacterium RBG_16_64_11 TaxID=1817758 RepID=A0A1F6TF40_9PROT|nr:MAG: hypothetical protein A2150_07760 [Candidatus Muproteobacteria bacterium RBG_16_64_11]
MLLCLVTTAFAQPQVTGISGSLTQQGMVTVIGSGFGTKANASPFSWDDFEGGIVGADLGSPVIGPAWTFLSQSPNPSYTDIRAHSGSKGALIQWKNYSISAFGWTGQGPYNQMYISFWRYMDPQDPSAVPVNHKILYLYPPSGTTGQDFMVGAVMASWDQWRYAVQSQPSSGWVLPNGTPNNWAQTIQKWQRWEVFVKMDNPYTASNGEIRGWINGQPTVDVTGINLSDIPTEWMDFRIGHLFQGYHPGGSDRSFFDDVYVDTTPARVEIGNAPTWSACTHREIQIPAAWSDSSINAAVNAGSFACGQQVYLYVVDADGNVNANGFPVTLCAGADTLAPAVPSNLTVQ